MQTPDNQLKDLERLIAEMAEKAGKQRSPGVFSIVLLAGLSSGIFGIGTKYVDPIDPRPDPYTGTQGKAEAQERQNSDRHLQRQIARIREDQQEIKQDHKEAHREIHQDVEWLKREIWRINGIQKNKD